MTDLLIYGATGYTGRLICAQARTQGLSFSIAGRSAAALKTVAASLGILNPVFDHEKRPHVRPFDLLDTDVIDTNLRDVKVLLNCAGPFSQTAEPLIKACIRNQVHYLDVSAELISYQLAERLDNDARDTGVMLLPGCGGSVAMFSCLVHHALQSDEQAIAIEVALHVSGSMSRGSAISAAQGVTNKVLQRREGQLIECDDIKNADFDFQIGEGEVECFPVTLPDLITVPRSVDIADMSCYVHLSGTAFPNGALEGLPDGPDVKDREQNPYQAAVKVTLANGSQRQAILHTVNGYTFTSIASLEAAERVLAGSAIAGFQTPVEAFGASFLQAVEGSKVLVI
jgi:short subunit dehydrogenase-like uncharacterized protein